MGERGATVLIHWLRRLFRRRTRVVAGGKVIDMDSSITMLDPDTSKFTTILMQLGRKHPGGYARPTGELHRGIWVEYWADWDAIADPYEARTREAINHFEQYFAEVERPTVNWMEDELFPRTFKIGKTDHPYLRSGDIVRVVASGK